MLAGYYYFNMAWHGGAEMGVGFSGRKCINGEGMLLTVAAIRYIEFDHKSL